MKLPLSVCSSASLGENEAFFAIDMGSLISSLLCLVIDMYLVYHKLA